jgi:hypothetical protein
MPLVRRDRSRGSLRRFDPTGEVGLSRRKGIRFPTYPRRKRHPCDQWAPDARALEAWSAPRAGESVDIGAIFRLAPGLIGLSSASGTVRLTVSDGKPRGGTASYAIAFAVDGVTISEHEIEPPT